MKELLHEQFQRRRIDELKTQVESSGRVIGKQYEQIEHLTVELKDTRMVALVAVVSLAVMTWQFILEPAMGCGL